MSKLVGKQIKKLGKLNISLAKSYCYLANYLNIFNADTKPDKKDILASILDFCSIPRTRAELEKFTGYSRYYTMSNIVQPLIDDGLLKLTIPDKPKSSKQKYIRA